MASSSSNSTVNLDLLLVKYLQQKGYKDSETALRAEGKLTSIQELHAELQKFLSATATTAPGTNGNISGSNNGPVPPAAAIEASLPNWILFYNEDEANHPDVYETSYTKLRRWVDNSIDRYKPELKPILYPLFVHSYLDLIFKNLTDLAQQFFEAFQNDHVELHGAQELKTLASITNPSQLKENPLAAMYRENKFGVVMSRYSFELLLTYLQDAQLTTFLRLVNQYISIRVLTDQPPSDTVEHVGITGHPATQVSEYNSQKVLLGPLPLDEQFVEEIEKRLKKDTVKNQDLLEQLSKIKAESSTPESPAIDRIPFPQKKLTDIEAQIRALEDATEQVALGGTTGILPSIVAYTFHNTYNTFNCLTLSEDASLVAAGTSDSFIDIWNLKNEKLRGLVDIAAVGSSDVAISSEEFASGGAGSKRINLGHYRERSSKTSNHKRLIGHSGPVYNTSISTDNRYLLSCSEDKTVRLWSLDTYTNLVAYRGHNYPVWDVAFSPLGFYFASASYDRTARLWSCDHIYPLRIFAGHLGDVSCLKFHPNANYLLTGSADATARMWDVQSGKCTRLFTRHSSAVYSIAVSPNGKYLATGSEDTTVALWDIASGKKVKTFRGHEDVVYSLDFSKDSSLLVSGGEDCTVKVWDVLSGMEDAVATSNGPSSGLSLQTKKKKRECLGSYPTKRTPVYKVKFTPRNLLLSFGVFS